MISKKSMDGMIAGPVCATISFSAASFSINRCQLAVRADSWPLTRSRLILVKRSGSAAGVTPDNEANIDDMSPSFLAVCTAAAGLEYERWRMKDRDGNETTSRLDEFARTDIVSGSV